LVVALGVFLDNTPLFSFGLGSVLTAELAPLVSECPTAEVNIITAVNTFFPVGI
jgi:hypothetical protein